jgi:hypothetical protein
MATPPVVAKRPRIPPPVKFAENDPLFNRWLHDVTNRSAVLNGTTAPPAGVGFDGDWYCNTTAKHIYVMVNGAWVQII